MLQLMLLIPTTMIFFSQESFTSLLTDEEMQQLIENFDRLDVNQGNDMILVTIQCN